MTNNTTAALTDEQRIAIQECIDYLKPAGKEFDDLGFGESKHTRCIRALRALLTSPRAAVPTQRTLEEVRADEQEHQSFRYWQEWFVNHEGHTMEPVDAWQMRATLDAAPAAPVADIPLIMWNGETKRNPELRERLNKQVTASIEAQAVAAPAAPVVALSEDDAANLITIDRRDLYGFVRGSIKRALEDASHGAAESHEPMSAVDCWSEAHTRTIEIFDSMKIAGIGEVQSAAQAVAADGASTQRCNLGVGCDEAGVCYASAHGDASQCGRAAVSPATAEPCAHDYVRADRVCTECGEKTATTDVTLPYENVLHDLIRKIVPGLDSGDILNDARTAINAVTASTMTDAQIDAVWENIDTRGSSLYEPHAWEIEKRRRFARAVATGVPVSTPATADERTAFVEKLRELGADISPLGFRDERLCITSNIMVDDVLAAARASQAAAPADAISLLRKAHRTLACAALTQIRDGEAVWTEIGRFLDAAPAEARESSVVASGLVGLARHVRAVPAYSQLVGDMDIVDQAIAMLNVVPADAGEAVAWESAESDTPNDEREVIVFLNGHCALTDMECRKGGGWGIRLGFYDHEKRYWRVHGQKEYFVTHWRDLPEPPDSAPLAGARAQGAQGGKGGEA